MKIDTQLKLSKTKLLLPCVLLLVLAAILFAGGVLLFMYSFVILEATNSVMIFFTLFASTFITIGLGLVFSDFGDRFLQKYLHTFGDKNNPSKLMHEKKEYKTTAQKILNFSNIYTTILILGVIFTIICVSLGALEHSNWASATEAYKAENGYYSSPLPYNLTFDKDEVDKVSIDLTNKNAVVIYYNETEKDKDFYIVGYQSYKEQIKTVKQDGQITISETPDTRLNRAKDKMLFFMFDENDVAKQIKIYIPNSIKDNVKITGDYILAK